MHFPPNAPKQKLLTQVQLTPQKIQLTTLIKQGFTFHQQGKFEEARIIYAQILKIQPNHFDALHLMGALLAQTKEFKQAIDFLSKALKINPNHASCNYNLGNALKELKRFNEALSSFDQAITIRPDYAEAYSNRGNILKDLKFFEQALASYNRAIGIRPDYAEAYSNRGIILQELKRFDEALESFDHAIRIKPNYAEAYFNRGNALQDLKRSDEACFNFNKAISIKPDSAETFSNRGLALQALRRFDEALDSFDQAISIRPNFVEAHSNRGLALQALRRFDEALDSFNQAISIQSDSSEAYSNRGITLQSLNRLDDALTSYNQAISIRPDYAEAYSNRGFAFQALNRLDDALTSYNQAIVIKPDYAEAHWNLSLCHLLAGNFNDGWQGYEWRWKRESFTSPKRNFPQPLWLGTESIKDKTILLHAEQGLGDAIQFSRYVPLVAKLGAKIILEAHAPLLKLLMNIDGVEKVFSHDEALPDFDYQCPLMSLPLAFKTVSSKTFPPPQCIPRDNVKSLKWQTILGQKKNPRVGIVWSGSTSHTNDHNRSLLLAELISYFPPNIDYICLQKEVREIDRRLPTQHLEIKYFCDLLDDFTETAALCEAMDLVIGVDTSIVHLAATLGKPTWVLLPFSPDWRWLLNRDDSPWYESVKLYRQDKINQWDSPLLKVKADLENIFKLTG